jgi:hypothetical protein
MSIVTSRRTTPVAFAAAFLIAGVPYWLVPYRQVNLPDALVGPGLLAVGTAALLLCALRQASPRTVACAMASVLPAVVMARVLVDGLRDPTSHNLWPFEVAIALVLGLASVLPGVGAGLVLRRLRRRDDGAPR